MLGLETLISRVEDKLLGCTNEINGFHELASKLATLNKSGVDGQVELVEENSHLYDKSSYLGRLERIDSILNSNLEELCRLNGQLRNIIMN